VGISDPCTKQDHALFSSLQPSIRAHPVILSDKTVRNGTVIQNIEVRATADLLAGGQALLVVHSVYQQRADGSMNVGTIRITLTPL
jgi:hypothetical protein